MNLDILPQTAFIFMAIFSRLGAMMMVMPALGESSIPQRMRLMFALATTLVLFPLVSDKIPPLPDKLAAVMWLIISEVLVGLAIGLIVRLVMSISQVAGTIIAFQTGLGFAQNVDPTQGIQAAIFASFLAVFAVAMIFAADLHHLLIMAIYNSYDLFRPGNPIPIGDFAELAVKTVGGAFAVSTQISAPFLAFGLLFYVGVGVLSRLMPQVQIFFVAMPINILVGLILFVLLIGPIMMWYLDHFEETVNPFLGVR